MKTTELRIGNYVMDSPVNGDDVLDVQAIYTNLIIHEERHVYNDELRPIPLTEEWLLRFGFKHSGNGFFIHAKSLIELANIGDEYFHSGIKGVSLINVHFVHQLQNLYFALVGEELQLN